MVNFGFRQYISHLHSIERMYTSTPEKMRNNMYIYKSNQNNREMSKRWELKAHMRYDIFFLCEQSTSREYMVMFFWSAYFVFVFVCKRSAKPMALTRQKPTRLIQTSFAFLFISSSLAAFCLWFLIRKIEFIELYNLNK